MVQFKLVCSYPDYQNVVINKVMMMLSLVLLLMMIQNAPGTKFKTERPIIPEHLATALIATIHLKRNHP